MPAAANIAFFNRTADVSPESVARERLEIRSVVRMWGQRDTVHVYASDDWPLLSSLLRARTAVVARRLQKDGVLADFRRLVRRMAKRLAAGERLTYKDVTSKKIEAAPQPWVVGYLVLRQLVREGIACHGPDRGGGSTFVHRSRWLPALDWTLPDDDTAGRELACRYLAGYGPAAPRDLAFWFGATVANARRWVKLAGDRIVDIDVDGQPLLCLADDLDAVATRPPAASRWPVKLLHRFDPLLLGTKDKDWLIEPRHYKRVWRPAGHIDAVILVGGRIAGTWRYDRTPQGLVVSVRPFEPLSRQVTRAVKAQARAVARFMGHDLLELRAVP